MKKAAATLLLATIVFNCCAQNSSVFVRHDTTLLKADECEWVIKAQPGNDPSMTAFAGKTVAVVMLEAIEKGLLKAMDPIRDEAIPAKDIFTWKMPVDSMLKADPNGGEPKVIAVQRRLDPSTVTRIRIFQDWQFDAVTAKLKAEIRQVELVQDVYTSMGTFIGFRVFCRINF